VAAVSEVQLHEQEARDRREIRVPIPADPEVAEGGMAGQERLEALGLPRTLGDSEGLELGERVEVDRPLPARDAEAAESLEVMDRPGIRDVAELEIRELRQLTQESEVAPAGRRAREWPGL